MYRNATRNKLPYLDAPRSIFNSTKQRQGSHIDMIGSGAAASPKKVIDSFAGSILAWSPVGSAVAGRNMQAGKAHLASLEVHFPPGNQGILHDRNIETKLPSKGANPSPIAPPALWLLTIAAPRRIDWELLPRIAIAPNLLTAIEADETSFCNHLRGPKGEEDAMVAFIQVHCKTWEEKAKQVSQVRRCETAVWRQNCM